MYELNHQAEAEQYLNSYISGMRSCLDEQYSEGLEDSLSADDILEIKGERYVDVTLACGGPRTWFRITIDDEDYITSLSFYYAHLSFQTFVPMSADKENVVEKWMLQNVLPNCKTRGCAS